MPPWSVARSAQCSSLFQRARYSTWCPEGRGKILQCSQYPCHRLSRCPRLAPIPSFHFLTLLCHSLSDALPVWRKLANVVWCFPHQGFKERMFFILDRVLSQWHSWLPCSALPTCPVAREARSLRVQAYSRDLVCEDNQETDFRRLNARVVQTKPFSLLLLKQTKRKTMVIVNLSEYKYRERIHLA